MTASVVVPPARTVLGGELSKIPAFFRRDLLTLWSYRFAFFSDWLSLLVQSAMFYFVGRIVDPDRLPDIGGRPVTYMQFVAVGIAISAFVEVALARVASAIRNEQVQGTLESLLVTPTAPTTIQLGSVMYDLAYVPLRTALFLLAVSLGFGVTFELSGIGPAILVLLAFIPFVWGLGVLGGAAVVTFRRSTVVISFAAVAYSLSSGVYFPVSVLPGWMQTLNDANPLAIAIRAAREALLGNAGVADVAPTVLALAPMAAVSMTVGIVAFRVALARERRRGTLGLY